MSGKRTVDPQGEIVKKILLGAVVSLLVFMMTDFLLIRRAQGETNVRQDAEIHSLRRDMTRVEKTLEELRALNVEILKEVRK